MSVAGPVRVALINDQPLFARGLELLLPAVTEGRVRVVATTDDASLASGLVRRQQPDIAVVDLAIADPGGLRAIAAIRRAEPQVPVLAMSDRAGGAEPGPSDQWDESLDALRAGAVGVVCKANQPEALIAPLLAAAEGWSVLPAYVLNRLTAGQPSAHPSLERLSEAERNLWRLVARGASVSAIAVQLHVSERTAKRATAALLRRLQVRSRTEAAALAGRIGLLDPPARPSGAGTTTVSSSPDNMPFSELPSARLA